ncbi:hypothetical protein B0H11DRAFT_2213554 [Mycena galericulata]|nr:hypothetical protein B0H11DRAFT_2213554 [Mycena galericulata]
MDPKFLSYVDVIFLPADGRTPYIIQLLTTPARHGSNDGARVPHPEAHIGLIVNSLEGMSKMFTHPYLVYYPLISRDGSPFPINQNIRDIQGPQYESHCAWKGDIIVGKCEERNKPFATMTDASMADFPIVKNFFRTLSSPQVTVGGLWNFLY